MTATPDAPSHPVLAGARPAVDDLAPEELRHELHHLRRALESRPVIDQAKGALMLRYGIDADEAFAVLRECSGRHGIPVRTLADLVVRSLGALGAEGGPGIEHHLRELALRDRSAPSA